MFRIPIPKTGGEVLNEGIQNLMERLQKKPLMEAQTQEAQAKANQANMLATLLSEAMGGQGMSMGGQGEQGTPLLGGQQSAGMQGQPTSTTTPNKPRMSLNQAVLAMGALGMGQPTVVNGQMITPFGTFKVGESEEEKRKGESSKQVSTDTLKATAESSLGSLGVNPSFDALDKIMENPNYEKIAGTVSGKLINAQPLGFPLGSMLQEKLPKTFTKEKAELAGQASAHFGNIVTGVAAKFKGPFKDMVNGVINSMKPNMGDSLPVQRGKIQELKNLSKLADLQNEMIANYVNQGMDSTAAIIRVSKEIPFSSVLNDSVSKINELNEKHPAKQTQNNNAGTSIEMGTIVMKKGNKIYNIPSNLLNKAQKEGFKLVD